jgi:tetratricopeptide (TPR) repeat protein
MKLKIDPREARLRHARYYCDCSQRAGQLYQQGDQEKALALFDQEQSQIDTVWYQSMYRANIPTIPEYVFGIDLFLWMHNLAQQDTETQVVLSEQQVEDYTVLFEMLDALFLIAPSRYPAHPERISCGAFWFVLAKRLDEQQAQMKALFFLGVAYFALGKISEAIWYFDEALTRVDKLDDMLNKGRIIGMKGQCLYAKGKLHEAAEKQYQALEICRQLGDKIWEVEILGFLASAMYSSNKALGTNFAQQQLELARETGNARAQATALTLLGNIAVAHNQDLDAIRYYEESLNIARQLKDSYAQSVTLSNLGNMMRRMKRNEEALQYYHQALAIDETLGNDEGVSRICWNIGLLYEGLGDDERALENMERWVDYLGSIDHTLHRNKLQRLRRIRVRLSTRRFLGRLKFLRR